MPKKQEWTVRVVVFESDRLNPPLPGVWVEQFRYMGLLNDLSDQVSMPTAGTPFDADRRLRDSHITGSPRSVYEIRCPNARGIDTKVWAESNAARMQSFGFLAAAAPKWGG